MDKLLSVCMIVKNEEKVLERCLESIHGIADEIVIVDTGSTDKTKEIATKYTDKLYDFKWINDFSKARNYAASKAIGEWIFVIDADEYVDRESFKKFKRELQSNPPKYGINTLTINSFVGAEASSVVQSRHTRLYKNNKQIEFHRPIHEELKYIGTDKVIGFVNLQIYHTGYMKDTIDEKGKTERNLSILLDQENKTGIDYFYIGNEYRKLNEMDKAILYYQKSYNERESATVDYLTKLLVYLIIALYSEKRYSDALRIIEKVEDAYPNYADYKYFKGLIFYTQKDYKKAKVIFEYILSNKDNLIVDHSEEYKEYSPLIYLANIYEDEGKLQKAVECFSRAVSINKANDTLWSRLLYLLGQHSPLEELTEFINRKVVPVNGMTEQRMIKILLNVPLLNVQKLSRSLLDHEKLTNIENEALLMKNLMLDLNLKEVAKILDEKSPGELTLILQTNIFTIADFMIQVHEYESVNSINNLNKLSHLNDMRNITYLVFSEKHKKLKLNEKEKNIFVNIYRQATVLGIDKIVEKLDKKLFLLDDKFIEEIKRIRKM